MDGTDTWTIATSEGLVGVPTVPWDQWMELTLEQWGLVGHTVVSLLYHGTNGWDSHLDNSHQWGTGGTSRGFSTVPWDQWMGQTLGQ